MSAITDDILEKVLHTRAPGGSEVWHVVDGGGMAVNAGHRTVVRRVLEAYEAARLPDANEGDEACPKAAECRACPCGFCASLRSRHSRQLDQLIKVVELRMAIAAAYDPLPAERRRLGLLAGIPAEAGTPVMGQLRRAANKKLEAVLATCKEGG